MCILLIWSLHLGYSQPVEKETYNLTEEKLCELKGGIF